MRPSRGLPRLPRGGRRLDAVRDGVAHDVQQRALHGVSTTASSRTSPPVGVEGHLLAQAVAAASRDGALEA